MPLESPRAQPERTDPLYDEAELDALVRYLGSLGGPPVADAPRASRGSLAAGFSLFRDHCAGCHQIVAQGGIVIGARVPPLNKSTPRQVAEAVRVGPYLMPSFSAKAITPTQLNDIVAYVQRTKHPDDRGGWAIGHLGPWPEGMVTWLLAASVLVAMCVLIGRRLRA
jgi:ubiquinol-cytochrome c reductase cytochrome c subunit